MTDESQPPASQRLSDRPPRSVPDPHGRRSQARASLTPKTQSGIRDLHGRLIAVSLGVALLGLLPHLLPNAIHEGREVGWTALVPPLVAVVVTLATRRLLPALGGAVLIGALLRFKSDVLVEGSKTYIWDNVSNSTHLYIIGFTLALLGMVQVVSRAGGTSGIVEWVTRYIRSARSTEVGAALMGLFVFFDDYANCMLVGPTMRPLTDRWHISREKLAYIVDSTAAPVAGLAVISTWIGHEVGLLDAQAQALGLDQRGYALVLSALPFRFYCVFSLVFVFASALMGRDFGPMLKAQRRARHLQKPLRDGARPMAQGDSELMAPPDDKPHRARNALIPILAVVLVAMVGFVVDGGGASKLASSPGSALSFTFWRETLGASENNVKMLLLAASVGSVLAIVLPLFQGILSLAAALRAYWNGVRHAAAAVVVLLLAWALAQVCQDLGAQEVLGATLRGSIANWVVPLATFGLAAAIAFATGTSWGTMSILIPIAVPLAHSMGGLPLMILTGAAVLDGAIFGDHCSPISDTTLMSSIASGSDHLDHVETQLPYAVFVMLVAATIGYLPIALGGPEWLPYVLGSVVIVAWLRIVGRRPEDGAPPVEEDEYDDDVDLVSERLA
ncbi:MAG: Na+/H+ antiporter NhaC family protein [Polyangiaceae bacterium]